MFCQMAKALTVWYDHKPDDLWLLKDGPSKPYSQSLQLQSIGSISCFIAAMYRLNGLYSGDNWMPKDWAKNQYCAWWSLAHMQWYWD